MGAREKTLLEVRVIHVAFVITWFLFVFVLQVVLKPAVKAVEPVMVGALALAAFSSVSVGWTMRGKMLGLSAEALRRDPDDGAGLGQWRAANVLSFAFAETPTLFGLLLKVLGADWAVAGWLFAGGLILLVLWTPRLESVNS